MNSFAINCVVSIPEMANFVCFLFKCMCEYNFDCDSPKLLHGRDGGRSGGRVGGGFKKSQPRETAATTTPTAVAGAPAAGTTEVHHHHHGGGG